MRRPLALILCLAAVLCSPAAASAADPVPPTDPPLALYGHSGEETYLARLDPVTLAPRDPVVVIPEWHNGYSVSPDGRRAAFTVSTSGQPTTPGQGRVGMRIVDLTTLETAFDYRIGVAASAIGWLTPRRIVAKRQGGGIVTADGVTGQFADTGRRAPGNCNDPPGKGRSRSYLAVLLGRRVTAIDSLGRVRGVTIRGVPGACGRLGFAVDGARQLAYVVGLGKEIAVVSLRAMSVRYIPVPRSQATRVDRTTALLFGGFQLAAAHVNSRGMPKGVELVDALSGARHMIDPSGGAIRAAGERLLVFDGRYPVSPGGSKGLRAYDLRGRLRYRLLTNEVVHRVEVLGGHAYAQTRGGLRVIDLRARRVVSRSALDPNLEIHFVRADRSGE
jgi:hypothetical protein